MTTTSSTELEANNIIKDVVDSIEMGVFSLVQGKYQNSNDTTKTLSKKGNKTKSDNITLEEVFLTKPIMLAKENGQQSESASSQVGLELA